MYLYNSNEETKGLFSVRPLQIPPKTDYLKLILHVCICVYMYVCMYTCMYVCMYVYVNVCMYVCMYKL